ncbi:MAG: cobalamin-dependent protein [Myxococcota bacterium]
MTTRESDPDDRRDQRARLTRTIQAEIIPRLMLAHRVDSGPRLMPLTNPSHATPAPDVVAFCRLLVERDTAAAHEYVVNLRVQGVALETIFLDLLAPCAHHLGTMWEKDDATFTDVTMGLTHLQQLVREYAPAFELEGRGGIAGHQIVLSASPGDQHTFGLILLEEFFRRAGWNVIGAAQTAEIDLPDWVQRESVSVVGFGVSDRRTLNDLQTLIADLRASSKNRELVIMVGGSCVLESPELVTTLGADGTASSAREAVAFVETLLERRASQPSDGN